MCIPRQHCQMICVDEQALLECARHNSDVKQVSHTVLVVSQSHGLLCCAGTLLNMLGMILIGCTREGGFNALPVGAVVLGLGGITYHLANFHISNLFPGKRGLISSLFVAGFTGCGIIYYILYEIYLSAGASL